jgi:hypothetical protein
MGDSLKMPGGTALQRSQWGDIFIGLLQEESFPISPDVPHDVQGIFN